MVQTFFGSVLVPAGLIDRRQNLWPDAVRDLQRASELDPRNGETVRALADNFLELRQSTATELLLCCNPSRPDRSAG